MFLLLLCVYGDAYLGVEAEGARGTNCDLDGCWATDPAIPDVRASIYVACEL